MLGFVIQVSIYTFSELARNDCENAAQDPAFFRSRSLSDLKMYIYSLGLQTLEVQ
jgi:hypothetical protein